MNERIITLSEIDIADFFGPQNRNLNQIKAFFPKLKIIARGSEMKAFGESDVLDEFEKRMEMLVKYFIRYNKLDENSIERLMLEDGKQLIDDRNQKDVLG